MKAAERALLEFSDLNED